MQIWENILYMATVDGEEKGRVTWDNTKARNKQLIQNRYACMSSDFIQLLLSQTCSSQPQNTAKSLIIDPIAPDLTVATACPGFNNAA